MDDYSISKSGEPSAITADTPDAALKSSSHHFGHRIVSCVKKSCAYIADAWSRFYEYITSCCKVKERKVRPFSSVPEPEIVPAPVPAPVPDVVTARTIPIPPYRYCENKSLSGKGVNYDFYTNRLEVNIDGKYRNFEELLKYLDGNYEKLEVLHNYVQWLFPLMTHGMNVHSEPLNREELNLLKQSDNAKKQFLEAFKIILDFWGMKLSFDSDGGIIVIKTDKWKERVINLVNNKHNFLRITRIIKSLENFGLSEYQKPLITFLMYEVVVSKSLEEANGVSLEYWVGVVNDPKIRNILLKKKAAADELAQNRFFACL